MTSTLRVLVIEVQEGRDLESILKSIELPFFEFPPKISARILGDSKCIEDVEAAVFITFD